MADISGTLNRNLELTIFPTEACNFRCVYCYEQHAMDRGMSDATVEGIVNLIAARAPGLNRLSVDWFGGEPLLRSDVVTAVMEKAAELQRGSHFTLNSSMTTNAYMLDASMLNRLVNLGVTHYQVTLDGNKEEHDKLRLRIDNAGTFDKIWDNLVSARRSELDFSITIRLHVNRDNEQSMRALLERISVEMGGDQRFTVYIRQLSRLGGPNDKSLPITEDKEAVTRLKAYAAERGLNLPGGAVYKEDTGYICYAAKPNAYAIRADGSVSKCTVALYDNMNTVGMLREDGAMELDAKKISVWSRGIFSGNEEELACPLKGLREAADSAGILRAEAPTRKRLEASKSRAVGA